MGQAYKSPPHAFKLDAIAAGKMERAPMRHKKATALLDAAARARLWGNASPGSSGSDRSAEGSSLELADLVFDSFYGGEGGMALEEETAARRRRREGELGCSEREMVEGLVSLGLDRVGSRIRAEAESAWRSIGTDPGEKGEEGWKRRLMRRLREKGFDAGLCKCRCERTTRVPAVAHEYVDVVADGGAARYIVDPSIAAEFEIARPTARYRDLLGVLPEVFVGTPEALRDVVRVMCAAAAESMTNRGMHLPPWRRREYVQGKWFGPYRRVTSRESKGGAPTLAGSPGRAVVGSGADAAAMGYQQSIYCCGVDCGRREVLKGRKLAVRL